MVTSDVSNLGTSVLSFSTFPFFLTPSPHSTFSLFSLLCHVETRLTHCSIIPPGCAAPVSGNGTTLLSEPNPASSLPTPYCLVTKSRQFYLMFNSHTHLVLFISCCYYCLVGKLCLTLLWPMDYSLPGSFVHGISQASTLEWVAISFSRGSSWSIDQTCISCLAGSSFTTEPLRKPLSHLSQLPFLVH